jgi:uncharacterized protein (TIGR02996 family)
MFPGSGGAVEAVWFSGEITPDDWSVDEPFFVLVCHRGKLLLEQEIDARGLIVRSRLTRHASDLVDPQEWGFLLSVQATPNDPVPRLVYADWLDERGDPRGQTLRQEVERASSQGFGPRNTEGRDGQAIPAQDVDPQDRVWFWKRLAGIPELTPEDAHIQQLLARLGLFRPR